MSNTTNASYKKQLRTLFASFAVGVLCFIVTGCANVQMGFVFNKDGSIVCQNSFSSSSALGKKDIEQEKANAQKQGFEIQNIPDGYIAKKTYKNIVALVNGSAEIWNPDENFSGVQMKKGLLYDYYSLDLFMKGKKYDIPKANFEKDIPSFFSPNVPANIWQYLDYKNQALNQAKEMNQIVDQATQAAIDSMKVNITISLPYTVDSTNATVKENEDKTLTWDMKPAILYNNNTSIQAKFRIYHENVIIGLIIVATIMLIAAIVCLIIGFIKKDNLSQRNFLFRIAGGILLVLVSAGIYVKYTIDNPPQLTVANRIVTKEAKDSRGNLLMDTLIKQENTPLNPIDSATEILAKQGINGSVKAISARDDNGFLAFVNIDSKFFFAIYDEKDNSAALIPHNSKKDNDHRKVLEFRSKPMLLNDGTKYYSPLIFNLEIAQDNKNSLDKDLGIWTAQKHIIPVYARFEVDENDKIVPGMLTSGRGLTPSHYQAPLKEQRNVNLANVLLTHIDSLKIDMNKRNIRLNHS